MDNALRAERSDHAVPYTGHSCRPALSDPEGSRSMFRRHQLGLCRVRSFHPERSSPEDIHSMFDSRIRVRSRAVAGMGTEHWRVRVYQSQLRR